MIGRVVSVQIFLISFINGLNNGMARLPPMVSWSSILKLVDPEYLLLKDMKLLKRARFSWTRFGCETDCSTYKDTCISEQLFKTQADRLVSDGFLDVGYKTVIIDDCWSEKQRDSWGRLVPDRQRFPSGIRDLSAHMHKRQLKLGIYSDVGQFTCSKFLGSANHLETDAETFAEWQIDFVRFDGCNSTLAEMRDGFPMFGRKLNETEHQFVYSCQWPQHERLRGGDSNYSAISSNCNLFKSYNDVGNNFASVLKIVDYFIERQNQLANAQQPGSWNDPDSLIIGHGLTEPESRLQMSVWSIWSAPLIMSDDLRRLGHEQRQILQNREVIAINQDPMGIFGMVIKRTEAVDIFIKPIVPTASPLRYSAAVLFMNRYRDPQFVNVTLAEIHLLNVGGYAIRNVWTGDPMGNRWPTDRLSVEIAGRDVVLLTAKLISLESSTMSKHTETTSRHNQTYSIAQSKTNVERPNVRSVLSTIRPKPINFGLSNLAILIQEQLSNVCAKFLSIF